MLRQTTGTDPVALSEMEPLAEAGLSTALRGTAPTLLISPRPNPPQPQMRRRPSRCRDGRRGSAGAAGHFHAYGCASGDGGRYFGLLRLTPLGNVIVWQLCSNLRSSAAAMGPLPRNFGHSL